MKESGLPSLDDLTTDATAVVIVVMVEPSGTLTLHAFGADGMDVDMGSILTCAAELADSEDGDMLQ